MKKLHTVILVSLIFILSSCDIYETADLTDTSAATTQNTTQAKTTAKKTATTTHTTTTEATEAEEVTTEVTTQAVAEATTAQTTTTKVTTTTKATTTTKQSDPEADYIKSLFDSQSRDVWVYGSGKVTRILSDDTNGDKHQRFILELSNKLTLLVAHNIDIAPRIDDIEKGDIISFYGEYIYTEEGGTLHWTHHDPDGSSEGGWLQKGDKVYK
jgi:hypothetical protein